MCFFVVVFFLNGLVLLALIQDQGGGVPVRPPPAGQVSAETVSVPLGGRRQVHLQQGELLGPAGARQGVDI